MTNDEKIRLFDELFGLVIEESNNKGKDYASREDCLANFKRQAQNLGMTPFQIWAVYFNKHIDSLNNAIKQDPQIPSCHSEPISSRIVDSIAYLGLLHCLLEDFYKEEKMRLEKDRSSTFKPTETMTCKVNVHKGLGLKPSTNGD